LGSRSVSGNNEWWCSRFNYLSEENMMRRDQVFGRKKIMEKVDEEEER